MHTNFFLVLRYFLVLVGLAAIWYFASKKSGRSLSYPTLTGRTATPMLDSFAVDFTRLAAEGRPDPVIGREQEVMRLAQILSRRTKNNAILIGAPGVGKTAIVEGLAQRIAANEVPDELRGKRVLALEIAALLSGTKYRGEFEDRAKKILREIVTANRSIILFVDEIHSIIQSHGAEGAINFSDILKPSLARGELQMIGATTTEEYKKYIQSDLSLERRFRPIEVKEPSVEETLRVLRAIKDKFREYHRVEFTDAALETAVISTKERIKQRKLPDKAIDAVDEAAAMVKVADLHPTIHEVLLQAAQVKHPEVAALWDKIQLIDKKISKRMKKIERERLKKERNVCEQTLRQKGVLTVDSDDVHKVVMGWKEAMV